MLNAVNKNIRYYTYQPIPISLPVMIKVQHK